MDRITTTRGAKRRKVKALAYYRARQWLILDWADRGCGGWTEVTARNRRQDCHPVVRLGDRRERSSVKPLIMPKQYTVGAPVSVPDPHCSGLVPSKFGASNEFQWNSCHPTVLSNRPDTWKLFRKRWRRWNCLNHRSYYSARITISKKKSDWLYAKNNSEWHFAIYLMKFLHLLKNFFANSTINIITLRY